MNEDNLTLLDIDRMIDYLDILEYKMLMKEEDQYKYASDFGLWLTERFREPITTVDWTQFDPVLYAAHKWDGTKNPMMVITQALANHQWVGVEAGTGVGKTFIISRIIYWWLDTRGGTVLMTAPTKEHIKNVLWLEISGSFHKFQRLRPHAEMLELRVFPDGKLRDKTMLMDDDELKKSKISKLVGIVGKKRAGEESSLAFQGYHDDPLLIVIDEAAGIEPSVMTAAKNTCSDPQNNIIIGIGNPDSMTDQLHEFTELENVVPVRISAKDFPNVVLGKTVIPGAVTRTSIEIREKEYGTKSPMYESRVRGLPPKQGVDSLFSLEWLEMISDENFTPVPLLHDRISHNAIGVDVANSTNGDMACLVHGKGPEVYNVHEFQCPDASHLAYNLYMDSLELAENKYHDYNTLKMNTGIEYSPSCIGIDGVGVGTATVQTLHNQGIYAISLVGGQMESVIPMDNEEKFMYMFNNLRSQMFWELREDARKGTFALRIENKLILKKIFKELMAHKYSTKSGKTVVMKKDDVKKILGGKSPNIADSMAYWNWMRKGYYYNEYMPLPGAMTGNDE